MCNLLLGWHVESRGFLSKPLTQRSHWRPSYPSGQEKHVTALSESSEQSLVILVGQIIHEGM